MIQKVEIENYKSLENLSLELGRFNVFIGENGCGKTNILESLVFAAAGINGKIENDFVSLRGGRSSDAKSFRSGFEAETILDAITITVFDRNSNKVRFNLHNDNQPFSKWYLTTSFNEDQLLLEPFEAFEKSIQDYYKTLIEQKDLGEKERKTKLSSFIRKKAIKLMSIDKSIEPFNLTNYLIYAPENHFLRNTTNNEPFVDPVGYRGEGLLKLVKIIKKEKPEEYNEIINHLSVIDWLEKFEINEELDSFNEFSLSDKYLEDGLKSFDIRNANEGFLFVLFYLTIFISDYTPKFFAIDNIDTALNPKLCSKLISILVELAKKHDKQVLITTHNPSVLDGLNLNDDEQRLFVVARNNTGRTRATRIEHKPSVNGTTPVRLSEQFLRGYIGGLPNNF